MKSTNGDNKVQRGQGYRLGAQFVLKMETHLVKAGSTPPKRRSIYVLDTVRFVMCRSQEKEAANFLKGRRMRLWFMKTGFNNWGKALEKYSKHEASKRHSEAVLKMQCVKLS